MKEFGLFIYLFGLFVLFCFVLFLAGEWGRSAWFRCLLCSISRLSNSAEETKSDATTKVNEAADTVSEKVSDAGAKVNEAANDARTRVSEFVQDTRKDASQKMSEAQDKMSNAADTAKKNVESGYASWH
jgi:gas vesicle protein